MYRISKCLNRSGFTLIEVLVVIVIIGVMAGAIVTSLSGRSEQARVTRAQSDITVSLSLALDLFETDIGRYPTASEGLKALVENPGIERWKGPYLKGGLKVDPWGNAYVYSIDPDYPGRYTLTSSGADGTIGSDDDIVQKD